MAKPPDAEQPGGRQVDPDEPPPILTWPKIYLLVIAALAVQVVVYTWVSRATQ